MKHETSFNDSTIVTGTTSTNTFLSVEVNQRYVGIPLYEFTNSQPDLDLVSLLKVYFDVNDCTLVTSATSYGAGISLYVNNSAVSIPIYKIDQPSSTIIAPTFATPTIVSQMESVGNFVAVKVNGGTYGVPINLFSSVYPNFSTTVAMSAVTISTVVVAPSKTKNIGEISKSTPSTNLNHKIKTYRGLIDRVKYQLGAPFVNLEICEDTQMVDFIDKSLEWYTKYAGFTEEYLVFNSDLYTEPGLRIDKLFTITPTMRTTMSNNMSGAWDYDMGDYRKVHGVFAVEPGESTGINTLFTLEQSMAQQTYFSYMLGNAGFDLVTWDLMKGWLDTREKVLAQKIFVDFDNRNQLLRLIPAPNQGSKFYGIVGAWVEKPVRDLIMERWVEHYVMALTKIAIGNIRGKFGSLTLFGGGTLNYNDFLSQGLEEKKSLEEELMNGYGEVTPCRFHIG